MGRCSEDVQWISMFLWPQYSRSRNGRGMTASRSGWNSTLSKTFCHTKAYLHVLLCKPRTYSHRWKPLSSQAWCIKMTQNFHSVCNVRKVRMFFLDWCITDAREVENTWRITLRGLLKSSFRGKKQNKKTPKNHLKPLTGSAVNQMKINILRLVWLLTH